MKKNIGRYIVFTFLILVMVCGSLGVGSLAQGSRGNTEEKNREAEDGMREPEVVEAGQSYAYVELKRGGTPILLVTDGTYGYNGLEASFCSVIYSQLEDGSWQKIGQAAGSGTAYPIRYDKNGIYITGGHFAAYYSVDREEMTLIRKEYAAEVFDENGNVTYFYAANGQTEHSVEDNSYLNALFDRYEKAELLGFQKSEKEDA